MMKLCRWFGWCGGVCTTGYEGAAYGQACPGRANQGVDRARALVRLPDHGGVAWVRLRGGKSG